MAGSIMAGATMIFNQPHHIVYHWQTVICYTKIIAVVAEHKEVESSECKTVNMPDVTQLRRLSNRATAGYSTTYNSFSCSTQYPCAKRKKLAVQKLYSNGESEQPNTTEVQETSITGQSSTVTGLILSVVASGDAA